MTDIDGHANHILLTRFEDVVRALGGVKPIAALTECSRSSVWNWSQARKFPAAHYLVIRHALARRGMCADRRLFTFNKVARTKRTSDVATA